MIWWGSIGSEVKSFIDIYWKCTVVYYIILVVLTHVEFDCSHLLFLSKMWEYSNTVVTCILWKFCMKIEAFIIFTFQNAHFTTHFCEHFYNFSTVIILNIMFLAIGMWWSRDAVHGLLVTCVHWSVTPHKNFSVAGF